MEITNKLYNLCAFIPLLVGIMVLIGWGVDSTLLTSIKDTWVSQKQSTSYSLIISSIMMYCMNLKWPWKTRGEGMALMACGWLFISISNIISSYYGDILLNNFFGVSSNALDTGVMSSSAGIPSSGTVFSFICVGLYMYLAGAWRYISKAIPTLLMFISGSAIIGHILDIHLMFYYIEGISTAMAIHTAVPLFIIGLGLRYFKKEEY